MLSFKRSKKFLIDKFKKIRELLIKGLQLLFKNIIDYLSKVETILYKGSPISNELLLEDLTANLPVNKKDNQIQTYIEALSFAVHNENVTNIALTGGFGTGKSTIINEFCKRNRSNEYLHISLASFKDDKSDEKLIETSIVQQILYYEKKLKIKESSYKRIHFNKPLYKIGVIFLLVIWLYSVIFLFFENVNKAIVLFNEEKTNIESIRLIFISGVIYILYQSFEKFKNIKFSKLTPSSLELVNEKTDKELSVFNRNIDEIIYFFEKTNTNIVIVEDIDRFSDDIAIKLYSKIRELSILIKQSKDVTQSVKFIYSVKDELILEDKTKFFDIIIPVIPITDYNNSKNMFLSKLASFFEKEKIENKLEQESRNSLDKVFISEIANYVYDMRTVINICNEFKLYNKILTVDKPSIDLNKLFAIVFYKNIFPDDFAKTQKQTSRLHKVFNKDFNDDEFLKKIISEIDKTLEEKIHERDKLKEEFDNLIFKNINELRSIYIFTLIGMIYEKYEKKIKEIESLNINDGLLIDENFKKIKESSNIRYGYENYMENLSGISFRKVENRINRELTYDERERHIKDFHSNKLALLEKNITSLVNKKQNIKNLSLFELYEIYNNEIDNYLKSIYTDKIIKRLNEQDKVEETINPNLNLFKYLFKNDYLNEDFIEYVSYFHLGSLSSNDYRLMMKINQDEFTTFDEKIDNAEGLINSIRDIRFKNQAILIYDIFEFLLQSNNYTKLNFFISQLQNYNDKTVYFIEGFVEKNNEKNNILSQFYSEITKWDLFWHLVSVRFSDKLKRKILFDLIQLFSDPLGGDNILIKLNKQKTLTKNINKDRDFLKDIFERISINSFIKTLKGLDVKFDTINNDDINKELLFKIYENNLYEININNLHLFSQIDSKYVYDQDLFFHSNFGFLRQKESVLYKRISQNLNQYIENVYLKIKENINEKPEDVLYLLEQNDEKISLENKLQIIRKGFTDKLNSFDSIPVKEIQTLLIQKNKIFSSWENILEYYSWESLLDSDLITFLNDSDNYTKISVLGIYEKEDILFGENSSCDDFIYELINDENLSQDSFEAIFADSGDLVLKSNEINIKSRISYLEEKDFFILDQEEIDSLIEKNKDLLVRLIEKNEKTFTSEISTYNFEVEFVENLLNSNLSIESLNVIIADRENDINNNENIDFLNKIAEFYIKKKDSKFTKKILEKLITSNLAENTKICLINLAFSDDNNVYNIVELLKQMGGKFTDILNDEKVSFDVNDKNKTFLNILKDYSLISSFKKNRLEPFYTVFYNN
jgi:hypothetical protein